MARVGGARVFFDVVGQFQAERLINDTQATTTVLAAPVSYTHLTLPTILRV